MEDSTPKYADDLKVREALAQYYKLSGFGIETYSSNWVELPVWKLKLYLPNFKARKNVVPLHDVDHILSEYPTSWQGEFEISGYELGTGLGGYWFGWMVNLQGIWIGIFIWPKQCLEGFARGRRSGSLFKKYNYDEELMNTTLGELRSGLPVASKDKKVTSGDLAAFVGI